MLPSADRSRRRVLRHALALALALAGSGCFLWPQPRGTEDHPTVVAFDIEGTRAISASELHEHLAIQPSGRKYLIIPDPQRFDVDAFANDQKRIVRYYQAHGYYQAKVVSADVVPDGPGRVRIRVRVDEGQPTRVTKLDIEGLDDAPEARQKLGRLPLAQGDVFTEAAYDAARGAILAALTSTGWAKAEVTEHAQVDPLLNEAHVRYTVEAGQRYRFGPVFVSGAAVIPRSRIREEAELELKPGQVYDATDLAKAQARIFDLRVFGGVRVNPSLESTDERKKTIPVVVSVREAPFRTIRVGPGLTFQATRWEADAMAGWQHRNWLGGLRKLSLDARVGYAWLPNVFNVQKTGLVALATADFTQPGVATRYVDFNVRAQLERGLEQAYDFWAERLRFGTPIKLSRFFTFVPSINLELYQLAGQVTQGDPTTGGVLTLQTCPGQNPNVCLVSYLEQQVYFDFRDDPINTTKGVYVGVSFQEGFSFQGNGASYLRILPEARGFLSLPYGTVLAARARIGYLNADINQVPIVATFMSGGPSFMRGYYTRQLSPQIQYCPVGKSCPLPGAGGPTDVQYVPVGGGGLVDGSLELRFPITGQLGGATFLDFGNVTMAAVDALNLANLQYALGVGIRYKTVFGPLRFDVATRLPAPFGDPPGVQVLKLTPVSSTRSVLEDTHAIHHPPYVSVHFSIGEAF